MAAPRPAAFIFIWLTVAFDMLAVGVIVPVLPRLVVQLEHGDVAAAAAITGAFGFAWALMQLVFSPVLGSLSDRFGRRPIILLSNFGLGLDYIAMALAPTMPWLFVGRIVSGITSASYPTASAYIADVTPPEKRAAQYGMLGAAFGLGFIVGPAIGGILGNIDLRLPFWVAAGLSLANAAYGYFVLPESLPKEKRSPFEWKKANPFGSMTMLWQTPGLAPLAATVFLDQLAHESLPAIFVLYTGYRYGWNERTTGLVLALVGVCSTIVAAGVTGPATKILKERGALVVGLACGAIGFAIYGLAPAGWLFCAAVPIFALMGIAAPALTSLSSERVGADAQGRLQGAFGSLRGVSGLIGPILFTQILARTIGSGFTTGAGYLVAAALMLTSTVISFVGVRKMAADVITAPEKTS